MKAMSPSKTLLNVRVSPEKKGGGVKNLLWYIRTPLHQCIPQKKECIVFGKI